MKLADLPRDTADRPLSRRIYAICWRPFGATWDLALKSWNAWWHASLITLAITYSLGGLLFLFAIFVGRAELTTFLGVFYVATLAGVALSSGFCALVLLARAWKGLFGR